MTNSNRREEVQKLILALLVTHKEAIEILALEHEYMEQMGEHVPWRSFGNVSLLDFLQNMPNIKIERRYNKYFVRALPTEKSNHITSLVANQRSQPKRKLMPIRTFKPSHYYPKTERPKIRLPAELLWSIVKLVKEYPKGITKDFVLLTINKNYPYINVCLQDLEDQLRELSHEVVMEDNLIYPVKTNKYTTKDTKKVATEQSKGTPRHQVPSPRYYVSDGDDSFDDYDSDDNPYSFNNFAQHVSSTGLSSSVDKKITCRFLQESVTKRQEQFNNNDPVHETTNDNEISVDDDNAQMLVNDRLKFRLEKLIEKYSNGIWCAQLPEKFFEEYKMELKYTELGFNSVREFASQLKDIFHCVQPSSTGDCILYDAKKMVPNNTKTQENHMTLAELHCTQFEDDIEAMPAIVSTDTSKKLIPEGVMTIGETVGQICVESLMNDIKPFVEVYVVEVFTPSFFWVQLRKKKKIFDTLMTHLSEFYTKEYKRYIIPPVVLEKGLNCACLYGGLWHRGIIKSVNPDLHVTVLFYDYGTVKTYLAHDIYYLDRKFSYLPAQAIPCGLINTQPKDNDQWTKQVTYAFAEKTSQIPLVMTIGSIDIDNNSMMVTLTNTLEDEDVHINDWLVEQNLAVHGTMEGTVDVSKLLLYEESLLLDMSEYANAADDGCDDYGDITNPPLVSPQSTLIDLPLALPPGLPIPNEPLKLSVIQEECPEKPVEYNHNASEASVLPVCLQSNPFLQDVYQTSTTADRVAIQLVITMWRSNLELQIPILKAYNGHLARMSSRTKIVPREMITRVEEATNHLISTLNALTSVVNNVDNVISDMSPLSTDETTSCSVVPSSNALRAPLNVSPSNEFYTFPETPVDKCHRMPPDFMSNDRVNRNIFDDTKQTERSFSIRDNNLHSTVLSRSDKSSTMLRFNDNDLGLSDIADRVQALTGNESLLEVNNISDAIDFSESVESTPVRKETNPFKMNIFDDEVQRKTVQAPIASPKKSRNIYKGNLSGNQEKIAPNLTHTPRYELFADKHELGLNNNKPSANLRPSGIFPLDNKSNTIRRNLFEVEERTVHNPTVSCSYFTYDKQTSLREVQHSTNINNTVTEQSPFTLPTYLSMIDNPNLDDEGYLTRPSTSDTLESSSPSGLTSEVDCFDQTSGATQEQSSSISAEAWIKSIENTIALNSLPSKHPDDTLASSNNTKCLNSVNMNSTYDDTNYSYKLANLGEKSKSNNLIIPMNIVEKRNDENEQKNLDDSSMKKLMKTSNGNTENISPASSCIKPLYFHVVELTRGPVYVFYFEDSGWISVDEFTEYFTPFGTFSFMLNMTHILDDEIPLREINRSCHPSMFEELDRSSLIASRDSDNKIYKISMISLQSGLKILVKFKIIPSTDWSLGKDKKGSILHDIYTLLNTYNNFKRRVDGGRK